MSSEARNTDLGARTSWVAPTLRMLGQPHFADGGIYKCDTEDACPPLFAPAPVSPS